MTVEIFDCDQRSPEWFKLRMGLPTASQFSTVMAKGRGGGESKTRRKYLLQLAGERLSDEPMDTYTNAHMERGREMEAEARACYAFLHDDIDLTPVGFARNKVAGASPDSLIGEDGTLEIKTALSHILLDILLRNEAPPEHTAQVQGQLWVTERKWCDLVVYSPKLPLFVKRIERDEEYISKLIAEVAKFNKELDEITERIREM